MSAQRDQLAGPESTGARMSIDAMTGVPFPDLDCVHWLEIQEPEDVPQPRDTKEALSVAIEPEEAM